MGNSMTHPQLALVRSEQTPRPTTSTPPDALPGGFTMAEVAAAVSAMLVAAASPNSPASRRPGEIG
jgi:hypothetical protein